MKRISSANFARKAALRYIQKKAKDGDYMAMSALQHRSNSTLSRGKFNTFYKDLDRSVLNELMEDGYSAEEALRLQRYTKLLKGNIPNPKIKIKSKNDGFANAKPLPKPVSDSFRASIGIVYSPEKKYENIRRGILGLGGLGVLGAGYTGYRSYKNKQKKPSSLSSRLSQLNPLRKNKKRT